MTMKKNYIHPAVQDLRWTGITMQTTSPAIGKGPNLGEEDLEGE